MLVGEIIPKWPKISGYGTISSHIPRTSGHPKLAASLAAIRLEHKALLVAETPHACR